MSRQGDGYEKVRRWASENEKQQGEGKQFVLSDSHKGSVQKHMEEEM